MRTLAKVEREKISECTKAGLRRAIAETAPSKECIKGHKLYCTYNYGQN